jgi:hypothetical protein
MYSNTKPQLVSNKILEQLGKKFKTKNIEQTQWTDSMGNFYEDYISPNLFAIIIFMIMILFLTIRYVLTAEQKKKKATIRKLSKKIRYKTPSFDLDLPVYNNNVDTYEDSVYDGSIYPEYMLKDELVDTGNGQLYKLQKEYEYNLENNDGSMSNEMMKDIYNKKTSKFFFDEMSRLVSGM